MLAYFSICVTRWFLRAVDKAASRAARLTVHLHIPFLQQLYRATTVRFRGMKSPLNTSSAANGVFFFFLPEFTISYTRERRKVRDEIFVKAGRWYARKNGPYTAREAQLSMSKAGGKWRPTSSPDVTCLRLRADTCVTGKNRRSRDRAVTAIANSHRDSEYAVTLFNVIGGASELKTRTFCWRRIRCGSFLKRKKKKMSHTRILQFYT